MCVVETLSEREGGREPASQPCQPSNQLVCYQSASLHLNLVLSLLASLAAHSSVSYSGPGNPYKVVLVLLHFYGV